MRSIQWRVKFSSVGMMRGLGCLLVLNLAGCGDKMAATQDWALVERDRSLNRRLLIEADSFSVGKSGQFELSKDCLAANLSIRLVDQRRETLVYECTERSASSIGIRRVETFRISDPPMQPLAGVSDRARLGDIPKSVRREPMAFSDSLSLSTYPLLLEYQLVADAVDEWIVIGSDPRLLRSGSRQLNIGVREDLEIEFCDQEFEVLASIPTKSFCLRVRIVPDGWTLGDLGVVAMERTVATVSRKELLRYLSAGN